MNHQRQHKSSLRTRMRVGSGMHRSAQRGYVPSSLVALPQFPIHACHTYLPLYPLVPRRISAACLPNQNSYNLPQYIYTILSSSVHQFAQTPTADHRVRISFHQHIDSPHPQASFSTHRAERDDRHRHQVLGGILQAVIRIYRFAHQYTK